jgi:hypothetical protein
MNLSKSIDQILLKLFLYWFLCCHVFSCIYDLLEVHGKDHVEFEEGKYLNF